MYYRICPHCKGNIDPGEKCDCRDKEKKYMEQFQTGKDDQIVFAWERKKDGKSKRAFY